MDKVKQFFNKLQVASKSIVFIQEQLNDKLLKKLKNSKYKKDKEFVNRFNSLEDRKTDFNNNKNDVYSVPIKAEYVQKGDDIDHSTLYNIHASIDILHADVGKKKATVVKNKKMAMDIIYKYGKKLDDDHKFSIDLLSNNEIQNMVFKERDEWLATELKLRFKKFEETDKYKEVKKLKKIKADQKNNITHGEIHTKLPNFTSFDHDALTYLTLPDNKTYEYYNVKTKKWT